ncbi:jg20074, partial [Pararge aegeria aegeria]
MSRNTLYLDSAGALALRSYRSLPALTDTHCFAPSQVDTINQLKTNREFFLSFSKDPQQFIQKWLVSQSRDLKSLGGGAGN